MDAPHPHRIDDTARMRYFTRPAETRPGYGWGRVLAAFALLAVAIAVVTVVAGLVAGMIAPIDAAGRAGSPAGQILHLALPVASWWIAVVLVARECSGCASGTSSPTPAGSDGGCSSPR
ncbi:hypothetical protein [Kytococcus sedentarius]|uniref:hypothetical protein n=1 Tax=Kytococcus sedentarius TaxID=1276 RepID=UPI0035BC0356